MAMRGDLITLQFDEKTSSTVHLHGATVLSWICRGEEKLFVSKKAIFDNKKAIRGGIPVVFPNFGPWGQGRPQHGFARTSRWMLHTEPTKAEDGAIFAIFTLEDDEETRKVWDFGFRIKYKLTLKVDTFSMDFRVDNTGCNTFDFTCLLHTYLRVPNIYNTGILGLKGLTYIDKVKEGKEFEEGREIVTIPSNYDRIYMNTPHEQCLTDGSITMKLVKLNLPDTVVWNPWQEKAAQMSDFASEEYQQMVCIEAGNVAKPITLEPGKVFKANQTFYV